MAIKHIEFWVSDLERSLKFYRGFFPLIGYKQIDENGFSDGNTKIYFRGKKVVHQDTIGPRHFCFLAASKEIVDEVGTFLGEFPFTIIRGPLVMEYKSRRSYTVDFKDPDGYVLEVATASEEG